MSKNQIRRIFLIVMDSLGIGAMPDASLYGDASSNTLMSVASSTKFYVPNLYRLGIFNIDGVFCHEKNPHPIGTFGRLSELSAGKDTTTGHWEIAGIVSKKALPTYPKGFPDELIQEFSTLVGRDILCNAPYSGTKVIEDFGEEHVKTGALIVYTSADSVFQIAAHEDIVSIDELYDICKIARKLLVGKHSVARVIARPFTGIAPNFVRTTNRHDFSLDPIDTTMLDILEQKHFDVISVGKINDIFNGKGVTKIVKSTSNKMGMEKATALINKSFSGLCFVNLVDFDMLYGHRNDIDGYAQALTDFDKQLGEFMGKMHDDDLLILTADHGCDPKTYGTDHTREYIPLLIYGTHIKRGYNLSTLTGFCNIGKSIIDIFGIQEDKIHGKSFMDDIIAT